MKYYEDLYGVTADQRTFLKEEESLIRPLAERLMDLLDVDLESCYSESSGGICYSTEPDPEVEMEELEVHLHPNHIIESDGDYWLEEQHQEFALLLDIGSEHKDLIEDTRAALRDAADLNLTLIRSTFDPDLDGDQPRVIEFELGAKEARD